MLRFQAPSWLRVLASTLALFSLCVPFTIGAILVFPIWDDAWVWLLLQEKGVGAITASFSDRPINAGLWSLLATSPEAFWRAALVAQAVAWPILGLLSARLWRQLFPELRGYNFVVACVAVAPFVTKVQMVTANIALASLLSVILGYSAFLLLLRFVATADRFGQIALALGLPILAAAILIQEYALAVVLVMLILLAAYVRLTPDPATRGRARWAMLLSAFMACAAYGVHLLLADRGARANVDPSYILTSGKTDLWLLFKLMSAVWRGVVGGFASSLSEVTMISKVGVLAVAYGILVGSLLVYGSRECQDVSPLSVPALKRRALLLVAALVAGLGLALIMGRVPWDPGDGMSSRFGLPVLPLAAMLTVLAGLSVVRQRLWAVPVFLFGFAAGNATFTEVWTAVQERNTMATMGAAVQAHLSSNGGYTVAVVSLPERVLGPQRQWELTARLAATWPPELREKFWAYRAGQGPSFLSKEEGGLVFGARGNCKRKPDIDRKLRRLVTRRGRIDRLLWVARQPDGSISVEPYCIGEPRHTANIDDAEFKEEPTAASALPSSVTP